MATTRSAASAAMRQSEERHDPVVTSRAQITRIAPDESQGHAKVPRLSKAATGSMFMAGIHAAGVPCDGNVRPGAWGDGTEKPCCSNCEGDTGPDFK